MCVYKVWLGKKTNSEASTTGGVNRQRRQPPKASTTAGVNPP